MLGCGTETVDCSVGWNGSLMSNCCTVLANQFVTYRYALSYDTTMSIGSSMPSSGPSTCWNSKMPSPSSSSASHTALVPGVLMNARRTPSPRRKRTISAPLFAPRVSVWITCSVCTSQTATSSPRQVGSIPAAHRAGDPNVVLIARSASGVMAKSYM